MRSIAIAVACFSLAACSQTVQWEEEVPLNTGEVIWVTRKIEFEMRGGFGNPFDIAMRPTRVQELRFSYAGRAYSYTGRANLILLAVSPGEVPNLIAPAADFDWANEHTNKYSCVVPFYVQLIPDASSANWTWPTKPEPWLYGMPANLMQSHPNLDERRQAKYSAKDRAQRDSTYQIQFPPGARIDPTYKEDCINWR